VKNAAVAQIAKAAARSDDFGMMQFLRPDLGILNPTRTRKVVRGLTDARTACCHGVLNQRNGGCGERKID
jgi:hypothetical protein